MKKQTEGIIPTKKIFPKHITLEMADLSEKQLQNYKRKSFVKPKVSGNKSLYSFNDINTLRIISLLDKKFKKSYQKIQFLLNLIEKNNLPASRIIDEIADVK